MKRKSVSLRESALPSSKAGLDWISLWISEKAYSLSTLGFYSINQSALCKVLCCMDLQLDVRTQISDGCHYLVYIYASFFERFRKTQTDFTCEKSKGSSNRLAGACTSISHNQSQPPSSNFSDESTQEHRRQAQARPQEQLAEAFPQVCQDPYPNYASIIHREAQMRMSSMIWPNLGARDLSVICAYTSEGLETRLVCELRT